ncbi:MAG: hypothetical protein K1X78_01055 [Verrucomicrobiaceae bacterium]|nr:hypothetical protein [Verrucomicrobiaceae bacterium]
MKHAIFLALIGAIFDGWVAAEIDVWSLDSKVAQVSIETIMTQIDSEKQYASVVFYKHKSRIGTVKLKGKVILQLISDAKASNEEPPFSGPGKWYGLHDTADDKWYGLFLQNDRKLIRLCLMNIIFDSVLVRSDGAETISKANSASEIIKLLPP